MDKSIKKGVVTASLTIGLAVVSICCLTNLNAIISKAVSTDPSPYNCIVPSGYTSIPTLARIMTNDSNYVGSGSTITSSYEGKSYDTFGTVTKAFLEENGTTPTYIIQSQSYSIYVTNVTTSGSSISVGNFVKVNNSTFTLSSYSSHYVSVLSGGTITKLYDSNPSPVESWEMTTSDWGSTAGSTSAKSYGNRMVTLQTLVCTTVKGTNGSYTNVPKFSFTNSSLSSVTGISGWWVGYGNTDARSSFQSYYDNATSLTYDGVLIPTRKASSGTITTTLRFILVNGEEIQVQGEKTINLYSLNDLHGGIETSTSSYIPGLAKWSTWFSNNINRDNSLLLANGDMWQGNGESNLNEGKLVTEWMNLEGFAAMSIGNHDFDWGDAAIKANKAVAEFPFLGANIYTYGSGESVLSSLGATSVIKEINGVKVGIIGAIGRDQYTSITASMVKNYDFIDPFPVIKSVSDDLRVNQGCDIIVLEMHAPQDYNSTSIVSDDVAALCQVSSVSNKKYIDVGFFGHLHSNLFIEENGVPLLRAKGDTNYLSKVSLSYNDTLGTVSVADATNTNVSTYLADDSDAKALVDSYGTIQNPILNVNVGSLSGTLTYNTYGANLSSKLIYDAAQEYIDANAADFSGVPTLSIGMANQNRNTMNANSSVTYRDCYKTLPFDNSIVIATVSGSDLASQAKYNNIYNPSLMSEPSGSTLYTVALYDYLAYHQNASHAKNYFPSITVLAELNSDEYFPRNLLKDYFIEQGTIIASNYSGNSYAWNS